ncbi:MAG: M48 family metallopeptidase [Acidobacteriota bacterium]
MNVYGIVILTALGIDLFLTWLADYLNLGALRPELPKGAEGFYDPESYRRSQEYTRAQTLFGYVTSCFGLVVLLAFWFGGGFNRLDLWLRGLGFGPVATGLIFIGALVVAKGLLDLPFRIYGTFVLEERFGFNRTRPSTFAGDLVKGVAVTAVLGAPILALVLYFFEQVGPSAWIYCWLLTTVFTLFFQLIFPTWILPLFNKFEPLQEGELRTALERYSERVGFRLTGIFVMDGSKRSSKSNAFFTGLGKSKRIALFDTLIESHGVDELVAVLAHEVGHYRRGHIPKMLALGIAHNGILFFLMSIFLSHRGLFDAFFMDEMSVYAGLVFFGLLYSPIEMLLTFAIHAVQRRHEFEADAFAAETTGDADAMANALEKLSATNLSNLTPHPLFVALNYSHPPVLHRIAAIRARA